MIGIGRHFPSVLIGSGLFTRLALAGLLIVFGGCGGGTGGSGLSTSPTITSVTVSCTPTSISTGQTSACTATVSGTGSYSSAVSWLVSPTSMGTVSSSGVYTPAALGTATITADSTQDTSKAGNAPVAVTTVGNPVHGGPLTVSPAVLITGTSTPTTVTVTGTNFIPASTVDLNGVAVTTTYVSATQLTFQLSATEEATSQQIQVSVVNPAPGGGRFSGAWLDILPQTPTPVISQVMPAQFTVGSGATTITVEGTNLVSTAIFPILPKTFAVLWNGTA